MRITHGMMMKTTLANLNASTERLERLQNELTSGQRISVPSDDPIGAATAVEFRATLSEIEQYVRNADSAGSWLEATDSALGFVVEALHRARELAVQGANDSLADTEKQAIAGEVGQLIDHTISLGNSSYAGQYLFAGFKINNPPFSPFGNPPTAVTYSGDNGQISRQLDGQATVVTNIPGNTALSGVFTAMFALQTDLNSGSAAAISARIGDIDAAIDSVLGIRSEVGARTNRATSQKERLESLKINIMGLLSKTQDVDMTEAITEFAVQQNVYQAALSAGAKAIQPSLLDYLR